MTTLKLKNSSEEAEPLVRVTMMSLRSLAESDPIVFYELVELCRDPKHELFGNAGDALKRLSLVQGDGNSVHQSIRNVVLSAAVGEGLALELANPVAA